jgi:signal transduction histidine kinase/ligand-binding sensor domain-containing protein
MQQKLIFLACFFVCANSFAQQYPFVHYTPREGLANNRARFVFQDSKGKLYIATYGGLSIYDGTRFINYNTNNGLSVALINDIVEMGEDSIWIMPNDNHIHCVVKGRLKNFNPPDNFTPLINQLIKCSDGYYYAIADEGLFRLENSRFIKISMNGLPGAETIKTLIQAVEIDKKLYILFNPEYKLPGSNLLVYDLSLNKLIALDKNIYASRLYYPFGNELWISIPQGLFMIDPVKKQNKAIELKTIPDSFHLPKNLSAYYIYKDRQNNIWFASPKGLYRIKTDGETTVFTVENGLTTNFQNSIFQDYENNMWFTNEQTGLCKLSNSQLAYYPILKPGYAISDIFINPYSDSVWMRDDVHHRVMLLLPNGQTKEWTFPKESLPFPARFVFANGKWILCGNSIFHWNAAPNGKYYSLSIFYKDSVNPMGFTWGISDKAGNLVTVSNKLVVLSGNKLISEPLNYMADQVTVDNNNRIWVAPRSDQLYCFELSGTGDSIKLSLLQSFQSPVQGSPRSITADRKGNIWIGTRDQGVYCVQFDGLKIRSKQQLTTINGLSDNFVNFLYCDKENNIWACTPSGLDKIKIDNDHFLVENITRSNNLYFPILKIQQTDQGLFWILTGAGIITYNPIRLANDWKPSLAFSDFVISDTDRVSIPANHELLHDQNNLSFQLSAPTYIDEKQTRFSYKLEGSGNKNWSTPSTDASINFVNLPPGEYTLRAKAIFLHGLYPNIESAFSFTILPPWWQTWWFKLLMGVLILALILLGLRFYINRKLQLQRVMLEKRRALEKERTRIATDMHDDLGAGLSQIKFLSETIGMRKQKHLPIEEEIDSIRTFSHEMIDKMGEIVWALNEKNDTISDLLSYTRSYAVEYLEQNGINCRVEEPENLPQDYVSSEFRRNIYLTVKETLHNVVKHAQATEVIIKIDITNLLSIQIKDNGKGFDNSPGRPSGNGLINMNNRIQGLGGRFEILKINGTQVNIVVPLNT